MAACRCLWTRSMALPCRWAAGACMHACGQAALLTRLAAPPHEHGLAPLRALLPPPLAQVFAGMDGISLRDASTSTPDATIDAANNMVCQSVVNIVADAVPLPFA